MVTTMHRVSLTSFYYLQSFNIGFVATAANKERACIECKVDILSAVLGLNTTRTGHFQWVLASFRLLLREENQIENRKMHSLVRNREKSRIRSNIE